ncbi:MAG: FtsX-like permease family protein, partial [Candidatus Bathyarchaeia archaeon]
MLISSLLLLLIAEAVNLTALDTHEIKGALHAQDNSSNNTFNITRVCEHVKYLSSLGSRTPGSPGYEKAFLYIYQNFLSIGLNPGPFGYFENFSVIVPVVHNIDVEVVYPVKFKVKEAWAVYPLGVAPIITPEGGIKGKVVYVGEGLFSRLSGIDLSGSIALVEYDNGGNWINLLSFGVKAIIFIEPDLYNTMQSSLNARLPDAPKLTFKSDWSLIGIPLNIPRIIISQKEAQRIIGLLSRDEVIINIDLRLEWEDVKATNILGVLAGKRDDEIIVLSAYYDSQSYVIGRAPGADESIGISFLMEMAAYFRRNTPERTLWFLALGSHYGGLKGAREFVERHFEKVSKNIVLWINFDFSSDSSDLGIFFSGYFYYFEAALLRYTWLKNWLFGSRGKVREILGRTGMNINVEDGLVARNWRTYLPVDLNFDHEPYVLAGGVGITIATIHSFRPLSSTPSDTYENTLAVEWKLKNVERQLRFTFILLTELVNEPSIKSRGIGPTRYAFPPDGGGFVTLVGKVVSFNYSKGWFEGVPNAMVSIRISYFGGAEVAGAGISIGGYAPRFYSLARTDQEGMFIIHGLPADTTYSSSAQLGVGVAEVAVPNFIIEAFVFDEEGNIIYAPEMWQQRSDVFPILFRVDKPQIGSIEAPRLFPVFKCGTIILYDLIPPNNAFGSLIVLDARGHTPPASFGFARDSYVEGKDINMIFVPGKIPIEIVLFDQKSSMPMGLLRKSSIDDTEGEGISVDEGQTLNIPVTQLLLVNDFYLLNRYRADFLERYLVTSYSAQYFLERAEKYLTKAYNSFSAKEPNYLDFYSSIYVSWQYSVSAYNYIKGLINETIYSTIFFFFTLVPFSILFTELIFGPKRGLKRILFSIAIFALFSFLLYCFHPGFHLATNIYVTLIGISIIIFLTPILAILGGRVIDLVKSIRREIVGKHFAEIGRFSAVIMSLSIGISNMRKRKLRSALTLITVILIIFSLVSLTSIYATAVVRTIPKPGKIYYDGIMISGFGYLPRFLEVILRTEVGDKFVLCPRTWIYTSSGFISVLGGQIPGTKIKIFKVTELSLGYEFSSILALTPEDPIFNMELPILVGTFTALIPDVCAERTGWKAGDVIYFGGYNLTIVGIFNSLILNDLIDLDQERVTPINWGVQWAGGIQHVPAHSVLIVPYSFASKLGFSPTQIVAKATNESEVFLAAKNLSEKIPFIVYAGSKGHVVSFQQQRWFALQGIEHLLLPILISVLVIFNSILASIYERSREISIYSTLGLSPIHISGLFLAESLVYAIIGVVLGYSTGLMGINILYGLNLMPQNFYPNFSSTTVIISLLLSILTIILSSLYPILKASKLATPSIERVWKLKTEPVGDIWDIPLPFTSSVEETDGVIFFLMEYFRAFTTAEAGVFRVDKIEFFEDIRDERIEKVICAEITLPPYDMGVAQKSYLIAYREKSEPYYRYVLHLVRKSGALYIWRNAVYKFVDTIRKQLLIW